MPIYAYRCRSCGGHFERHQNFAEVALRLCPNCRKRTLNRIISRVGIIFKGPGFYSTDNRPGSKAVSPASGHKEQKAPRHKENAQRAHVNTPPEKTDEG